MAKIRESALLLALLVGPLSAGATSPVSYSVNVNFPSNSASLGPGDFERIVDPLKTRCGGAFSLYFAVGHSDRSENGDKMLLSSARAATVAFHVLQGHPEIAPILWNEGKGDAQPVSRDPDKNRRVEIEVVCDISKQAR